MSQIPKVSIIVPVFNVEKYLCQCIESILMQTLKDIEIICVDDGSTDSSPAVLDEYARSDSRVKVIHKENRGYGQTMNVGFDAALGEYIGIVESDDCIAPDMYETLYYAAKENTLDIVKSDFYLYWGSLNYSSYISVANSPKSYNTVYDRSRIEERFAFWMMNWTGIYKKSFIRKNDIRHNETLGASFQDNGFWLQVMSMADSVMWIDKAFYMYRQDNPMSSMKRKDKMMDTMVEYDFAIEKLKRRGITDVLDIISYYRLCESKKAFLRIDDTLKYEYLPVLENNYKLYKNSFDVIKTHTACLNNKLWFEKLVEEPQAFCDSYISSRSDIMKKIDSAKNIYVYGAGRCAEAVFKRLYNFQILDKIAAVVETKECHKRIFGFDVQMPDVIENNSDSLIIVSVYSDKSYNEIVQLLTEKGCHNIISGTDISRNFYAI